ncbi:DUF6221 family protein [Streptomyces capoamus]|uniref:DUF6221 family protein n=1 Tax=Streptomyces capoamus TaxID=68183 RepID=UPI003395C0D1
MPDLHGWITQQITHLEALCRSTDKEHSRDWIATWVASTDDFELLDSNGTLVARSLLPGAAGLLAIHDPAAVLRRCAADRKILDLHKPLATTWSDYYACAGCGYDGADYCSEPVTEHVNDCPTLLALADGYGLTEEQRAALDRPEKERPPRKPGFGGMPDALAGQMIRISLATVPPALRGPNWRRPA